MSEQLLAIPVGDGTAIVLDRHEEWIYGRGYAAGLEAGAAAERERNIKALCIHCSSPGYGPAVLGHVPHSANAQDWHHKSINEHYHPDIILCDAAAIRALAVPAAGARGG